MNCPRCGTPDCYDGFFGVDCVNPNCIHFKEGKAVGKAPVVGMQSTLLGYSIFTALDFERLKQKPHLPFCVQLWNKEEAVQASKRTVSNNTPPEFRAYEIHGHTRSDRNVYDVTLQAFLPYVASTRALQSAPRGVPLAWINPIPVEDE